MPKKEPIKKTQKMPNLSKKHVLVGELAEILGLSVRRVQQLRSDGAMVTEKTEQGQRYLLTESLYALSRYLLERQDSKDLKQRIDIATAEYKERKAELMKIELRKRRGEVHEARHVELIMSSIIVDTRAALLSLPGRIAHDLAMCAGENEIASVLKNELCGLMRDMASKKYDPQEFRELVESEGDYITDDDEDE